MRRGFTKILAVSLTLSMLLGFAGCGNTAGQASEVSQVEDITAEEEKVMDITGKYVLFAGSGEAVIDDVTFDSSVSIPKDNQNLVFYQIFVGSFSDSDGDGTGDLRGIINRLDYLNDGDPQSGKSLGVEGIWLSPIFKSPSYHKYDVTDYYEIDEEFGTMEDLKELVSLCHERGIKVILDMVINHTGKNNRMFIDFCVAHKEGNTDSEWYDFYSYSDSVIKGKACYQISGTAEYYEGNFSSDMPEPDFDNEAVRNYFVDVAKYYLTDIGVDGFRFDAAKYVYYGEEQRNVEFWDWYMSELKAVKPDIYTVAEVWSADSETQSYSSALNCFDFTMAQSEGMIAATAKKGDVNKYCSYVEQYIETVRKKNPEANIVPFIANHDMDRAAGYMTFTNNFGQMAANLYILGPGSPFIYYGEEIGMKGSRGGANTDANRRLAMLWGDSDGVRNPVGANFDDSKQSNGTVREQEINGNSPLNYYKRVIMVRQANPEIYLGEYKALSFSDTKVGGFISSYEGSNVCVIHNTTDSEKTIDLSEATDIDFTKINAVLGYGRATLEGTKLTVSEQTSVVLR